MSADRHLSLYDGLDRIGMVIERGGCVDAFDVNDVHLSTFKKTKAAISAVSAIASPERMRCQRAPGQ
jgi:hypothetical protein